MSPEENIDKTTEKNIMNLIEKRRFYANFRQVSYNWVLIGVIFAVMVFFLINEIIFHPYYRKPKLSLPFYFINLIMMIVIQGEWQKYKKDISIIDPVFLLWFSVIHFFILLQYNIIYALVCAFLLFLLVKYLINRENRLAISIADIIDKQISLKKKRKKLKRIKIPKED